MKIILSYIFLAQNTDEITRANVKTKNYKENKAEKY